MTAVLGGMKYNDYSNKLIAEMQAQLVGKTLTAHSTHMEGLGWIIHEYSQLTFNDESSLDYAFISTTGPKEEDELPASMRGHIIIRYREQLREVIKSAQMVKFMN